VSQNDTNIQTQQKKAQNLISSQQKHSALPFIPFKFNRAWWTRHGGSEPNAIVEGGDKPD